MNISGVNATTAGKYNEQLAAFDGFCLEKGIQLEFRTTVDDDLLLQYLQSLRGEKEESGEYVPSAPWKVLSAMKARSPGSLYPWSEKFLRDWAKAHEPFTTEAYPLTLLQAKAVIVQFLLGEEYERAICALLQWLGWLRVNEALKVKNEDLFLAEDGSTMLRLKGTKTRLIDIVKLGKGPMVQLLWSLIETVRSRKKTRYNSKSYITGLTLGKYVQGLETAFTKLEIRDVRYANTEWQAAKLTSHSFRRGAATHHHSVLGWNIIQLKQHGRWKSTESLERYLAGSLALISTPRFPDEIAWLGRKFEDYAGGKITL